MKKFLTVLNIVTVIVVSGCGGSGSEESVNLDAQVQYKTSGDYDLKEYIAPSVNSINTYRELSYVNQDGKKSFKGDAEEEITAERYDIQDNIIIIKDGNDVVDDVFVIKPDRIEEKDDVNSSMKVEIARYVNIGDYVLVDSNSTDGSEGIPIQRKTACKLVKHYGTKTFNKKEYSDILQLKCRTNGTGTTQANGIVIRYNTEATETSYVSKNLGEVYTESISCQKVVTTINGTDTTNATCEKEIRELVSSNKI